jgi:hypothetical protein
VPAIGQYKELFINPCDSMAGSTHLVHALVYAGAIPFIGLALLAHVPAVAELDPVVLFQSYALVIVSFLCGAHWGLGLAARGKAPLNLFLTSNALVVLLWLVHALLPAGAFMLLFCSELLVLLLIDRRLRSAGLLDPWYYVLRVRISAIVAGAVVVILAA